MRYHASPPVIGENADTDFQCDTNGNLKVTLADAASSSWQYAAAAGGILNTTTAVTIAAAGGAGVRNYLTSINLMAEAVTAATELVIRDGAAGTVIYRTKIPPAGLAGTTITFGTPLRGSAATLMEIATLTATIAGAVYCNAQGYQAT